VSEDRDRLADYYTATAEGYDDAHVHSGDEHHVALEYMLGLFVTFRVTSVLDVGCGTGRAVRFILSRRPELRVVGLEPVDALRRRAEESGLGEYVAGTGEALPYADQSFDAVVATGILHHVPDTSAVVAEMTRVARRLVMISDTNRFGSGGRAQRLVKSVAFRVGLGRQFTMLRTRGRGYLELEGDGLHYPYSPYDQLPQLAAWADRLFMIPTSGAPPRGWLGPLLNNSHVLAVAGREPYGDDSWATQSVRPLMPDAGTGP
jgi:SAM-dependent methyltransferase